MTAMWTEQWHLGKACAVNLGVGKVEMINKEDKSKQLRLCWQMVFGKQPDIISRERCSQAALLELGPVSTDAHRASLGCHLCSTWRSTHISPQPVSPHGQRTVSPPSSLENAGSTQRERQRAERTSPSPAPARPPPGGPAPARPLPRQRADRARRPPAASPRPCGSSAASPALCGCCCCSPAAPVSSARRGTGRDGLGRAGGGSGSALFAATLPVAAATTPLGRPRPRPAAGVRSGAGAAPWLPPSAPGRGTGTGRRSLALCSWEGSEVARPACPGAVTETGRRG